MNEPGKNNFSYFFSWFKLLEESNLILSFKGEFDRDLINAILIIASGKIHLKENEEMVRSRIFSILVELLQNIRKHGADDAANGQTKPGIVLIGKKENAVIISTGNLLLNSEVEPLSKRIDHLRGLTKNEIRKLAMNVLMTTELSSKSGGNLGLIKIARKSDGMNFTMKKINEQLSFFSLEIVVPYHAF